MHAHSARCVKYKSMKLKMCKIITYCFFTPAQRVVLKFIALLYIYNTVYAKCNSAYNTFDRNANVRVLE